MLDEVSKRLSRIYREPLYDVIAYFQNRESRRLYRCAGGWMVPRPAEQKVIHDLRTEGISVVQFSDLLPAEIFEHAREWAERLFDDETVKQRIERVRAGERPKGKFYQIRPFEGRAVFDTSDSLMEICLSDTVLRIVSSYFAMFPKLNAANLWYTAPVSGGPAVFSQRWHRDPEDRKLVKVFLYLRDVDDDAGPFCYIPGSHNRGVYGHIYPQEIKGYNYPGDPAVEQRFPVEYRREYPGNAGTLIFCDTTGFHRGGRSTGMARMLLNAVYTTNASPWNARDRFRLTKSSKRELGPVAQYATDHLRAP